MTSEEIDTGMTAYDNPMKDVAQRLGEIVLATLFSGSKQHAALQFHVGASIAGEFPHLTGAAHAARTFRVASVEEAEAFRGELGADAEACLALDDLAAR